jgi:hypothetical protein
MSFFVPSPPQSPQTEQPLCSSQILHVRKHRDIDIPILFRPRRPPNDTLRLPARVFAHIRNMPHRNVLHQRLNAAVDARHFALERAHDTAVLALRHETVDRLSLDVGLRQDYIAHCQHIYI